MSARATRSLVVGALIGALLPAASGAAASAGRSFTLVAGGDILIQRAIADAAATYALQPGGYDFAPLLQPIEPWIADADFAVCHLESTLSPDNTSLLYDETGWPRFSGPYQVGAALATVGFDACSLSSNHAWDRGRAGIADTIEVLEAYGIGHTGTARTPEERFPALYEVNGIRVGHISYSTGTNFRPLPADARWVMNVVDTAAILADARWAREQGAEFTVVSLHWGTPYQMPPDGPQRAVAAALTASPDVDLILGHHTHMAQPVTRVNGKLVVYGMGDLLSGLHALPSHGRGAGDGFLIHVTVAEQAGGGFAVTEHAVTPTWVDPITKQVLPIDHVLAADGHSAPAATLQAARELTLQRIGLLGDPVPLTPTPWPSLVCAGRVATIIGTAGDDTIIGTPGDDVIVGRGGNDIIYGGAGDDLICAGDGDDLVWGGPGNDIIYGGPGDDRLFGEAGNDRLAGGDGNDSLVGGDGNDALFGQAGDDLLVAGPGTDHLWGGSGRDLLIASTPADVFHADDADFCRLEQAAVPCL